MRSENILEKLPYAKPFLFVDELEQVTEDGVVGTYLFNSNSDFYQGHFKENPVTPGVLLTECCAQIGVVCLGIFLLGEESQENIQLGLSSSEMEFIHPVYPNERVKVVSEKMYFRFQKLKCKVKMYDSADRLVCKGTISGMFKTVSDEK